MRPKKKALVTRAFYCNKASVFLLYLKEEKLCDLAQNPCPYRTMTFGQGTGYQVPETSSLITLSLMIMY